MIDDNEGAVRAVFKINTGPVAYVRRIDIVGMKEPPTKSSDASSYNWNGNDILVKKWKNPATVCAAWGILRMCA